jgi:hypothetical protein
MGDKLDKITVSLEQAEAGEGLSATAEKVHSPSELESKMIQEEKERLEKEPDQEETACMMLKVFTPLFNAKIDQLSNRQLRRVIKSLVEFPLGRDYKHNDKTESECFAIGQALLDAKMVLVIKTYNDNRDEIIRLAAEARAAADEASKQMTIEFNINEEKEVTNG